MSQRPISADRTATSTAPASVGLAGDANAAPAWSSWVLKAAAVYNIAWGAAVILFPHVLFRWAGMPETNYPEIWQCVGMIVGVYGVGYWVAGDDPRRHWVIVLVGFLGKIFGPIGFAQAMLSGRFPPLFGVTIITNDLIWWIPFALILLDARRAAIAAAMTASNSTATTASPGTTSTSKIASNSAMSPATAHLDGIDHVAIPVSDVASAVNWYREHFRCDVTYEDKTWAMLQMANTRLAFVIPEQHPAHIAFTHPNAEQFGKLKLHRDGTRSCYISDPSGNPVEILAE